MSLRPYQLKGRQDIEDAWANGANNVLFVLPTGGGKTRTFSNILLAHLTAKIVSLHSGASCAIAHRQELVSQISLALNGDKVRHRIIAPPKVVKSCVRLHMSEHGVSYFDPSAQCAVAGVDTLIRRGTELAGWLKTVTLWVQDEAHHVLQENKWGIAAGMFPNAKGLGVTATPLRADGKGLGSHCDGLFDAMVIGPSMRDLINAGYLVDYRIFAPPSDLDLSQVAVSKVTGDYNKDQVISAVQKSHVMGDVVDHYLRIARGKQGITFAVNVAIATEIAERFNQAGVASAVVSADTPDIDRYNLIRRFRNRELQQLVNVDLFGEGVDIPAVEVVSFARPTQSYSLYVQQFGRALRLLIDALISGNWENFTDEQRRAHIKQSKKPYAIIIDHVGNCIRHGLPDAPKSWSLDRREARSKKNDPDAIPVKACMECTAIYERIYKACPYCGFKPIPSIRSAPEHVDGDLHELDPETLKRMRGEIEEATMTAEEKRLELAMKHVPYAGQLGGVNKHKERLIALNELRDQMAWWGGYHTAKGRPDSEIQRRFYFKFGIDVLSAQALRTKEAIDLRDRVAIDNSVNIAYNV